MTTETAYFVDTNGDPLEGLTPSFASPGSYKTLAGVDATPPAVTEIGGGHYKFTLSAADRVSGIVAFLDGGVTAAPRYWEFSCNPLSAAEEPASTGLEANALVTVATLESELGIPAGTKTAILQRIINSVSMAIEKYCDRKFNREVIVEERVAGYGTPKLLLERRPLVSIEEVTIQGVTVDDSEYYIEDAEVGSLYRDAGWDWTARIQPDAPEPEPIAGTEQKLFLVSYTGGYILPPAGSSRTLPYDLEQAAIIAGVAAYRARGKYAKTIESTLDGESRPWYDYILPPNCRALLAPYKRVV